MFSSKIGPTSQPVQADTTAEEITKETGKAMRQILMLARTWIEQQKRRPGQPRKLSRGERKQLIETLQTQVGEQRMAEVWNTKRVLNYQSEVAAAHERRQAPGYSAEAVAIDDNRLGRIRYAIESAAHQSPLSFEQRGQVAIALTAAELHPDRAPGEVFKPMTADQERFARAAASRSEIWVEERRAENERLVEAQRAEAERKAEARREARPPRPFEKLDPAQRDAIQQIRYAYLGVAATGGGQMEAEERLLAEQRAVDVAREAGLTRREITHELENGEENTAYVTTFGDERGGIKGFYPSRETAIAETGRDLASVTSTDQRGLWAKVAARTDGPAAEQDQTEHEIHGDRHRVLSTMSRWAREPEPVRQAGGERTTSVVSHIDRTGRMVSHERVTQANEVAAIDAAHRSVTASTWSEDARVRVEVTNDANPKVPRYEDYGLPTSAATRISNQRVATHGAAQERALAVSESARQQQDQELASLKQRHNLSIEHSADLTDRNAALTRQLSAMTAERDQFAAERDQYRGERDEAVAKVIEMTPPAERYGSKERCAAEGRSALADYKSGSALAAAMQRKTERNGAEHEGAER